MEMEMEMEMNKGNPLTQNSRKRKRKHTKGINKHDAAGGIDKLSDDILIAILSCMSLKDAVKTSIVSRRWRYLWTFTHRSLEFDDNKMEAEKFKSWVNHILNSHRGRPVDSLIIRFSNLCLGAQSSDIDSWVSSAIQKDVKRFELNLSAQNYEFPGIEKLLSGFRSPFVSLKSLRLVNVDIEDEVVRYFLASCPYIEILCIRGSNLTKNLEIVDPSSNLKELEISDCSNIQSMGVCSTNLISCTYQGRKIDPPPFNKTPNLRELTLGGEFCKSFIFEPNKHSRYSARLVKLVLNLNTRGSERPNFPPGLPQLHSLKRLELNTVARYQKTLLFFISLIKASPNLRKFRIKLRYLRHDPMAPELPYPKVTWAEAADEYRHDKLKVVEMIGFTGFEDEKDLLDKLAETAPSLEMVIIDTRNTFFRDSHLPPFLTRREQKKMESDFRKSTATFAMVMACRFPSETQVVVK